MNYYRRIHFTRISLTKCQFKSSEPHPKLTCLSLKYTIEWTPLFVCSISGQILIHSRHLSLIYFFFVRCCATGIIKICLYNIIEIVSSILLFTHGVIMDFLWYIMNGQHEVVVFSLCY